MAPMIMYAVVYGREYEDIVYFSDLEKAKYKLYVQARDTSEFFPFIQEYAEGEDGIFRRTKAALMIDPVKYVEDIPFERRSEIEGMLVHI